jgi:hypothetical protein
MIEQANTVVNRAGLRRDAECHDKRVVHPSQTFCASLGGCPYQMGQPIGTRLQFRSTADLVDGQSPEVKGSVWHDALVGLLGLAVIGLSLYFGWSFYSDLIAGFWCH